MKLKYSIGACALLFAGLAAIMAFRARSGQNPFDRARLFSGKTKGSIGEQRSDIGGHSGASTGENQRSDVDSGTLGKICRLSSESFGDYEALILQLEEEVSAERGRVGACMAAVRNPATPPVVRLLLLGIVGAYSSSQEKVGVRDLLLTESSDLVVHAGLAGLLLKPKSLEEHAARARFWRIWYYLNSRGLDSANQSPLFGGFLAKHEGSGLTHVLSLESFTHQYLDDRFPSNLEGLGGLAVAFSRASPLISQLFFNHASPADSAIDVGLAVLGDLEAKPLSKRSAIRFLARVSESLAQNAAEKAVLQEKNPAVLKEAVLHLPAERSAPLLSVRYWSDSDSAVRIMIVEILVRNGNTSALRSIAAAEPSPQVRSQLALQLQSEDAPKSPMKPRFVELLTVLAQDPDESVRANAAHALGHYISEPGVRSLLASMRSGDSSERVRSAARDASRR